MAIDYNIAEYVISGRIGNISFGLSRNEIKRDLGAPRNWLGRPPNIGPTTQSFEQADVWFYYGDSVGVRFGSDGTVIAVVVHPEKIGNCPNLFEQWTIKPGFTLGDWRQKLILNNILFRESDPTSENYWIVAADTCVAYGFAFKDGVRLHGHQRFALPIAKYADVQTMTARARFLEM